MITRSLRGIAATATAATFAMGISATKAQQAPDSHHFPKSIEDTRGTVYGRKGSESHGSPEVARVESHNSPEFRRQVVVETHQAPSNLNTAELNDTGSKIEQVAEESHHDIPGNTKSSQVRKIELGSNEDGVAENIQN